MSLPDKITSGRSGGQPASQQRRTDTPYLGERLGIGALAPLILRITLGEEQTVGCGFGPMVERLAQLAVVITQRLSGADVNGAVGAPIQHGVRCAKPHRTQRCAACRISLANRTRHRFRELHQSRVALGPRFSRKSFSRAFASPSACAIDEISASMAKPLAGFISRDPRQRMHDREIGQRRVSGDALRQFEALGEAFAVLDEIRGQPDGLAFLGGICAAGQHHVHHARDADQRRQSHRAAAADIDAATAFRQRVVGRALGDAHMRGGGKLETAADHCAMQHGNHRHFAELDLVERPVPEARMGDALGDVPLFQFPQVETRGEMSNTKLTQAGTWPRRGTRLPARRASDGEADDHAAAGETCGVSGSSDRP